MLAVLMNSNGCYLMDHLIESQKAKSLLESDYSDYFHFGFLKMCDVFNGEFELLSRAIVSTCYMH